MPGKLPSRWLPGYGCSIAWAGLCRSSQERDRLQHNLTIPNGRWNMPIPQCHSLPRTLSIPPIRQRMQGGVQGQRNELQKKIQKK